VSDTRVIVRRESVASVGFIINVILHVQTAYDTKCTVRSVIIVDRLTDTR